LNWKKIIAVYFPIQPIIFHFKKFAGGQFIDERRAD